LYAEAYRFDFFQAVRLLSRIAGQSAAGEGQAPRGPVGGDCPPADEIVRFRALAALGFPSAAIHEIRPAAAPPEGRPSGPAQAAPPEMIVTLMGLTGPMGILPRHYTAQLISRIRNKDYALRDFLDLFHHRLISLFCRAAAKYHFDLGYEQNALGGDGREDRFTQCLYCLVGLGTDRLRSRVRFDDEAFLFYAGQFAHWPRAAVSLQRILGDYFALPAAILQFQGQWLHLSAEDLSELASPRCPAGRNNRLGSTVIVGERVWDVQSRFRVRLGPLGYDDFRQFLPASPSLELLGQMVRCYVGPQFDFDVQLVLKAAEVPGCVLGGAGPAPARLGWNTWVRSGPLTHDADDAVFYMKG
jgi:type VI secretion system protein ImpH